MKKLYALLVMVSLSGLPVKSQVLTTVVQQGAIRGIAHDGYVQYPAIPYAEPPVGNLRWKAPVPKKAWEGEYYAETYAQQPPQGEMSNCSEDCLYLSVQTPAKSKDERLPVFVMIHGGAYISGSYAGTQDSFVREGIVYVSIEYRLGALGFMSHPELSKESAQGVSGNYGIMDQIMALQWVHDNITAFGGDPQNVTIAGESAGGISVSILCASPLCKGLFQRAICESGSSFWPVADVRNSNTAMCTSKSAEQVGLEFQRALGVKNMKQLRKVSAETIVNNTRMESFWPVVDGVVITGDQYKLYEAGQFNDVDVIMGTNSDEGWMFSGEMPVAAYEAHIRRVYGSCADELLKLYPATNPQEVHYAMADIFRDGSFAWGTYAWANLQSRMGKKNVYLYYFDQNSGVGMLKSPRGAVHVAEMPFIYTWQNYPMNEVDQHIAQIMPQYWINFCKTGNPNADGLPYWTTYQPGAESVMNIHNGFSLTTVPNLEKILFFERFFEAKRQGRL